MLNTNIADLCAVEEIDLVNGRVEELLGNTVLSFIHAGVVRGDILGKQQILCLQRA